MVIAGWPLAVVRYLARLSLVAADFEAMTSPGTHYREIAIWVRNVARKCAFRFLRVSCRALPDDTSAKLHTSTEERAGPTRVTNR